jgi:hypothetical protein
MNTFPTLKFELEGIRQTLLTSLGAMNKEIEEAVDAELSTFIKQYNYTASIRSHMQPILDQTIARALTRHFEYGPGKELLDKALAEVLTPNKRPNQ